MGLFSGATKTKQQVLTDLLPATVNHIRTRCFDEGFFEFIDAPAFAGGLPVTIARGKDNMCEFCAAVMAVHACTWLDRIEDKKIAATMIQEMAVMIAATSQYTVDQYLELIKVYYGFSQKHEDPRCHIAKQLAMRLRPVSKDLEYHSALTQADRPEKNFQAFALWLFANIYDMLKIHQPLIEHVNRAR
jgi:hypothetical protein